MTTGQDLFTYRKDDIYGELDEVENMLFEMMVFLAQLILAHLRSTEKGKKYVNDIGEPFGVC